MSTAGLILAAGAGRRLGQPKAELVVAGRRLLDIAAATLLQAGCRPVIAVVRDGSVLADGVRSVVNPLADTGMGSSLRIGLTTVSSDTDAEACVIVLVDQLGITAADVAALRAELDTGAEVLVMRRGGRRSHPVLLARSAFADFAEAAVGDAGGRAFIDGNPQRVRFLDAPDVVHDIDTPADLSRWG